MRNFFLFIAFLVYVMCTKYLIELHFNYFGPYRIQPGTWAVDWRGIIYLLSSAFITAFLLNLLFMAVSQAIPKSLLLLGGLSSVVFFFVHQAVQLDLGSAINSIQFRPLHAALVNLILFAAPLVSYCVAAGIVQLYSTIAADKS